MEKSLVMIDSIQDDGEQRPGIFSVNSNDSDISVLYKNGDAFVYDEHEFESISSVCGQDGPPLEQRKDIVETKGIPSRLKETLNFNDEAKLLEVEEQMKARENIDRDMENNIERINKMETNDQLEDVQLVEAAGFAREKVTEVREVAKRGKTTLKRAMEVIEVALPPFLVSCDKSYEKNDLSEEIEKESRLYEECLMEKKKSLDFDLGEQKRIESRQHLEKCIDLAKDDELRISDKLRTEVEEGREKNFVDSKKEMDDIIKMELDDVHSCLTSCRSDLKNIENIQEEQKQRFTSASKSHETCVKTMDTKLSMNRQNQEDLRKQLENLKQQEKLLVERRKFEQQVQERAKEWNDKVSEQLNELQKSINNIHLCATTSLKVMELMKEGGGKLLSVSINAEEQYLNHLKDLDIEAKTKWRNALATSAVECRVAIDNATGNIDEYKETYKGMREDLSKATQRGKRLDAERLKNEIKEHKNEIKQEEKKKKEAEEELNKLMETIIVIDEKLLQLGRSVDSVDDLYEWKKQEMDASTYSYSAHPSLEFSENEASDEDEN